MDLSISSTRFVELIKVDIIDAAHYYSSDVNNVVETVEQVVLERYLVLPGMSYQASAYARNIDATAYVPLTLVGSTLTRVNYSDSPENRDRVVYVHTDIDIATREDLNSVASRINSGPQILPNRISFS